MPNFVHKRAARFKTALLLSPNPPPMVSAARIKLLVNLPDLLIDIHPLPPLHLLALLQLPVIAQRRFLPPRGLLFADDWLSSHPVEDIAALRRQPFEVRCDVAGGEVGGGLSLVGLEALFFPSRVEEFDWSGVLVWFIDIGSGDGEGAGAGSQSYSSCVAPVHHTVSAADNSDTLPWRHFVFWLVREGRNHCGYASAGPHPLWLQLGRRVLARGLRHVRQWRGPLRFLERLLGAVVYVGSPLVEGCHR